MPHVAKKRMSGEQFLDICDKLFSPLTSGVSLTTIAAITQPLTEKLGMKTGSARSETFYEQPGTMLVAVLCSLAQNGQDLLNVSQASDGCLIEVQVPSDIWSLAAELKIAVRPRQDGTSIDAAVTVKGNTSTGARAVRDRPHLRRHHDACAGSVVICACKRVLRLPLSVHRARARVARRATAEPVAVPRHPAVQ